MLIKIGNFDFTEKRLPGYLGLVGKSISFDLITLIYRNTEQDFICSYKVSEHPKFMCIHIFVLTSICTSCLHLCR